MKKAFIIAFVISLSLAGCNRNNPLANSQSTFDIDGKTFTVINPQGISEIKMPNALVANGSQF